ncbi:MAG: anti-sigma factor antagonist [Lachnospiraceae bacterium]
MKILFCDGVLLIRPEGRIDSENAPSVEKEIFSSVESNFPKYVVIDAEKLEYISSAGLRVILKLKKAVDNTQIVNASSAVYDIFDMTGFTDILNVRKTLRTISVDGCRVLGEGQYGTTYKLNNDTIVKLYKPGVPFEDMVREKESTKAAFISGVPTVIPFDTVKCGERYGTVYELLNSRTLGDAICANPAGIDEYAHKTAELLKILGTTHDDSQKFFSFVEIAHKNADILNNSLDGGLFTADEIALIHKLYDSVPERDTLIHGDLHTHNIFEQDGELLLIDMADTSMGHPIFEFGHMYLPYHYLLGQGEERVRKLIGLDIQTAVSFFSRVVRFYFKGIGEDELSQIMGIANIIGHIRMMFCALPTLNTMPVEMKTKYLLGLKSALKEMYFDKSDQVIGLVKKTTALF